MPHMRLIIAAIVLFVAAATIGAQTAKQPKVAPGANEPDLAVVLRDRFKLSINQDLLNPVRTTANATPGLFRRAGGGMVRFLPVVALGLETKNRGGWYTATTAAAGQPGPIKRPLWSYVFKNTSDDLKTGNRLPPPLEPGSTTTFDPGEAPFGFWISNDGLSDGGVFTEPAWVARLNQRLASQPYKAMIYPRKDPETGKIIAHSYLICWEYSTNDDFQDVICQVDNAILIEEPRPSDPR